MGKLVCRQNKLDAAIIDELVRICPFKALEENNGRVEVNSGCKMCLLCVKKGPAGVMEFQEDPAPTVDKDSWKGVAVYVEQKDGGIHPVTLELIGKARELAAVAGFPVYCVFAGYNVLHLAEELLYYGVDEVFVYDREELKDFRIEPHTAVLEDFINKVRPSALLVGATAAGRSLAPRTAARFHTGLTADCTSLEMKEDTDLVQIRPAFGGNIMARILCTRTRPQMATVRYKVMNAPERSGETHGRITLCDVDSSRLASGIKVLKVAKKAVEEDISDAETIIAVGRALKNERDLGMVRELADALGGVIAGTRPMVEAGLFDARRQIGLSGRTVKPKLILTLGVSGAVQFTAGMSGAACIFAVNTDPKAPIFQIAHYGVVGDIYEIVPRLIDDLKSVSGGV